MTLNHERSISTSHVSYFIVLLKCIFLYEKINLFFFFFNLIHFDPFGAKTEYAGDLFLVWQDNNIDNTTKHFLDIMYYFSLYPCHGLNIYLLS